MSFPQSWPKTLHTCPECGAVYVRSDHFARLLPDSPQWCLGTSSRHSQPVRCEPVHVAPLDEPRVRDTSGDGR